LDLNSLGGLLSTDVNGVMHFTLTPTLNLTIGFLTGAGLSPMDRVYLGTIQPNEFVLSADVNTGYAGGGAPVTGTVSLGGIAKANIVQARLKANPQLTVNLDDVPGNGNRVYLSQIAAGDVGNLMTGNFSGLLQAVVPIRVGGTAAVTP